MALILTLVNGIRRLVTWVVIAALAYMTVAVWVQVVSRYIFGLPIAGATETATWAQIWMVLLAAGLAMQRNMHVAVEVVAEMLPLWPQRLVKVVLTVAALWFLSIVFLGGLTLVEQGARQTTPFMNVPMSYIYLALPIGSAYLALEVVIDLIRRWSRPFGTDYDAADGHSAPPSADAPSQEPRS